MTTMMLMIIVIVMVSMIHSNAYVMKQRTITINHMKKSATTTTKLSALSAVSAVSIAQKAATIPLLYCLMSVNEYITHRFYQHAEFNKITKFLGLNYKIKGGGHVEHHAETRDDMSLKIDDEQWKKTPAYQSLSADKYRGTAFSWSVFGLMIIQMMVSTVPLFKYVLGYSFPVTMMILVPALFVYTSAWNTLHPGMHGLEDNKITEGPPSSLLAKFRNSAYFKYIEKNHIGHHIMPCNYNVCAPGADMVFGTHVPEEVWRKKQRIEDRTAKELVLN
jgi:hypothetical protein